MRRNSDDNSKPIRNAQGEQETGNNGVWFKVYGFKFTGGQSLIEVLVAFTVSIIVGMALVSAGLATQKASISARNKSQGTKLAQEYLEQVRLIRDVKGYTTLFTTYANGCYSVVTTSGTDPSSWTLFSASPCGVTNGEAVSLNNTNFYRKVTISDGVSANSKKVVVDVSWAEGVNTRSVSEETTFSKWCDGSVTGANASPCP